MKLEYLFTNKKSLDQLSELNITKLISSWKVTDKEKQIAVGLDTDIIDYPDDDAEPKASDKDSKEKSDDEYILWILIVTADKENKDAARLLSRVNDYVCGKYQCAILTNDSAAYFNKCLYPLVNSFERKLRKLLYLMSALSKDSNTLEQIKDIESRDFGELYKLLFTDDEFNKNVRTFLKDKNKALSRYDLIKEIGSIEENTLWDKLNGNERVPSLSSDFDMLRIDRNHVMHAHNISYETFSDCQRSFKKINKELDKAIEELQDKKSSVPADIGQIIDSALRKMNIPIVDIPEISPEVEELVTNISKNTAFGSPEFQKAIDTANKAMRMILKAMGKENTSDSGASDDSES